MEIRHIFIIWALEIHIHIIFNVWSYSNTCFWNVCSALFLLMIESECELHLNSTYILKQLSDESESFTTYRQIFFFFYFLCINSSLIWLFIKFCFFYHDLGGCSVWSVAGSQSTPDGQTLNPVIKYEYFIYNTESNPLVHPHVETQGLLELQGVTVAITAPLNASDHLTVHADYHSFVKLLILIWERWRCWIAS